MTHPTAFQFASAHGYHLPPEVVAVAHLYRVKFNPRFNRAFGRCTYHIKLLELHSRLEAMPDQLKETFLHELAHAWAGSRAGHGVKWKLKAIGLGAKPIACYDNGIAAAASRVGVIRPPQLRPLGLCSCGWVWITRRRAVGNVQTYDCPRCAKPIQPLPKNHGIPQAKLEALLEIQVAEKNEAP